MMFQEFMVRWRRRWYGARAAAGGGAGQKLSVPSAHPIATAKFFHGFSRRAPCLGLDTAFFLIRDAQVDLL